MCELENENLVKFDICDGTCQTRLFLLFGICQILLLSNYRTIKMLMQFDILVYIIKKDEIFLKIEEILFYIIIETKYNIFFRILFNYVNFNFR